MTLQLHRQRIGAAVIECRGAPIHDDDVPSIGGSDEVFQERTARKRLAGRFRRAGFVLTTVSSVDFDDGIPARGIGTFAAQVHRDVDAFPAAHEDAIRMIATVVPTRAGIGAFALVGRSARIGGDEIARTDG